MTINEFKPKNLVTGDWSRIIWRAGDIWKTDSNGCPHRLSAGYNGELFTLEVPEAIPMKYKNRKLGRLVIWCNSCEQVTGVEAHYGQRTVLYDGDCRLQREV